MFNVILHMFLSNWRVTLTKIRNVQLFIIHFLVNNRNREVSIMSRMLIWDWSMWCKQKPSRSIVSVQDTAPPPPPSLTACQLTARARQHGSVVRGLGQEEEWRTQRHGEAETAAEWSEREHGELQGKRLVFSSEWQWILKVWNLSSQ